MAAAELARHGVRSLLVEGGGRAGRGTAYSTREAAHLLNVSAAEMSAWADAPDDFIAAGHEPGAVAPRRENGAYLRAILDKAVAGGTVEIAEASAVAAARSDEGWEVTLGDGRSVEAKALVLAHGNQPPEPMRVGDGISPALFVNNPWREEAHAAIARLARTGGDAPRHRAGAVGWRAAVDALRPHSHAIWASFDEREQRRFLRHGAGG